MSDINGPDTLPHLLNPGAELPTEEAPSFPFPIVGIGASAGGLEAITQLLKGLPPDPGMPFLVVQHLDPNRNSMLRSILAKATSMPVIDAAEGMAVSPNRVYLITPRFDMSLADGALRLKARQETPGLHMPIDMLFRSMAKDQGRRAIGVILSGGGTDGTLGLEAIKGEGGITFAQDEKSAQHESMPRSAVAIGCVDYILAPEAIAQKLVRIARHPYVKEPEGRGAVPTDHENQTLKRIFGVLSSTTGLDFTHYKRSTILRRLQRRLALRKVEGFAAYHRLLLDDPDEVAALHGDLLISVTSFFRDPKVFDRLTTTVFPAMIEARASDAPVRIWVSGCATGEEVYSLAICLLEALGERASRVPVKILATDVSENALKRARSGTYIENIALDVSPERLRRFFVPVNSHYQISKSLRDLCVFSRHNVTRDPPFAGLDLISCRNVLIYLDQAMQKRVVPLFHYALKPGGNLLLGSAETIGAFSDLFNLADRDNRIYEKRPVAPRLSHDFDVAESSRPRRSPGQGEPASQVSAQDVHREIDRLLLGRYAPPGVLIDENLTILQFRGLTGPFLEPSPGAPSFDLLKMAREGLLVDLRSAVAQAKASNVTARREGLRVKEDDRFRTVTIEVVPLRARPSLARHFVVLFVETTPPAPATPRDKTAGLSPESRAARETDDMEIVRLRQEADETNQYIQSLVEEHEATREELVSANEEILSSNEELQSTNEELQTAKEEMQSSNEELATVNDELRHRNLELAQVNDDLQNLINGVNLPIVMVSRDLRVRRFTPLAGKVMNLIPTDVGRPIGDIRPNLDMPDLVAVISEVIDELKDFEREVQDRAGHWYSVRIKPYITVENKVDGASLVAVDIDALRRAAEQLKNARDYADAIVETVWEPLVVLDGDLRVKRANSAYYRTFRATRAETEGRRFLELNDGEWDVPALRSELEKVLPDNARFHDLKVFVAPPEQGRRSFLLNGHQIYWEGSRTQMVLLSMEDVTEREREAEQGRLLATEQAARAEAELANRTKDEFLAMLAHELRNPLAPVRNAMHVLRDYLPDEPAARDSIAVADRQIRHMARLLDDLLDVSRITQGKVSLKKEPVALGTVLTHAIDAMRHVLDAADLRLEVSLPGEPLWLEADPHRLEQAFSNLLHNSAKYTEPGGRVWVSAERRDGEAIVRVRDTGVGIAPDLLPRIFDLFTQADRSLDRSRGGLGIGLTLVRSLVVLHGGEVRAESGGVGLGSEFVVRLPGLIDPPSDVPAAVKPAVSPQPVPALRVLVVDDNVDSADTLASILKRRGHTTATAHDGPEALRAAEEFSPEVVLLDIGLPGLDGFEVARTIRARETTGRSWSP